MAITNINSYADSIATLIPSTSPLTPPTGDVPSRIGGLHSCKIYFQITFASQASGEDVLIGIIPKGYTILGGSHISSATLANSATTAIGLKGADESGYIDAANSVSDNVAYLKAAAALSTTLVGFALTQALGFGYTTEKDLYVTLTTGTGTVATEVVRGYIDIMPPV